MAYERERRCTCTVPEIRQNARNGTCSARHVHLLAPSLPGADEASAPQIVLRDGSVTAVRIATRADADAVRKFFASLSPESRYRRFLSAGEPSDAVIGGLCGSSHPGENLTLVAERSIGGEMRMVAVASYVAVTAQAAEAAFAVSD